MKKLRQLFTEHPGYSKKGSKVIAEMTGLKEKTVDRFKRSQEYKDMKRAYIDSIDAKYADNMTMIPKGATTYLDSVIN